MCCLFGLIDYRHSLTTKQKNRLASALAVAAEARGTDATGIAYNSNGKLRIYKRPWPAHYMRFSIPEDAAVIMGHTRMTTQGSERKNRNNHPFPGRTGATSFALAHNGMLCNDKYLRSSLGLPRTKIEPDSYIGVQMIEQKRTLDFASLQSMAEQVEGSFCFTVLSQENDLYIVKGDNPLCLYHFPTPGVYVYASTEEILKKALGNAYLTSKKPVQINLGCGDILQIGANGNLSHSQFDTSTLFSSYAFPWAYSSRISHDKKEDASDPYLEALKDVASSFGYTPEVIDRLEAMGFGADEIEEFMCCGCYEGMIP